MKDFFKKFAQIQQGLKAPKGQYNSFGKYNYRNCEDILGAVKPLLGDMVLTLNDELVPIEGRVYIKATATLSDGEAGVSASAFAKESISAKGMSDSQITGSASSYARKYALNGLFGIDDVKDDDNKDNTYIKPRNYIEEEEIKTNIKRMLADLTNGLNPQEKGKFLVDILNINSFIQLNSYNSDQLREVESKVLELWGKR